jgi:hypothetical protein
MARVEIRRRKLENKVTLVLQLIFPRLHSDIAKLLLTFLPLKYWGRLGSVCKVTLPNTEITILHPTQEVEKIPKISWAITTPFYKKFQVLDDFELFSVPFSIILNSYNV